MRNDFVPIHQIFKENGMKRFFSVSILVSALLICLMSGCASTPSQLQLVQRDSGHSYAMCVGSTITIRLEENATTGYSWYFASPLAPEILLLQSSDNVPPSGHGGQLMGAPGERVFVIKAIGPGTTGIKLEYRRLWEKNVAPAERFDILVTVSGEPEAQSNLFNEKDDGVKFRVNSKGEKVPVPPGLLE